MIGNPILFGEGDNPTGAITPVKWIASDGTSCIDIGFGPNDYAWNLLFTVPAFIDFTERTLLPVVHAATDDSSSAELQMSYGLQLVSGTWSSYFRDGKAATQHTIGTVNTTYIPSELDLFLCSRCSVVDAKYYISYNNPFYTYTGGKYYSNTNISTTSFTTSSVGTVVTDANIHLFGLPDEDKTDIKVRGVVAFNKSAYPNSSHYYDIKSVAHHYIAALKDGVAGMYDLVTGDFKVNSVESGNILWGND